MDARDCAREAVSEVLRRGFTYMRGGSGGKLNWEVDTPCGTADVTLGTVAPDLGIVEFLVGVGGKLVGVRALLYEGFKLKGYVEEANGPEAECIAEELKRLMDRYGGIDPSDDLVLWEIQGLPQRCSDCYMADPRLRPSVKVEMGSYGPYRVTVRLSVVDRCRKMARSEVEIVVRLTEVTIQSGDFTLDVTGEESEEDLLRDLVGEY